MRATRPGFRVAIRIPARMATDEPLSCGKARAHAREEDGSLINQPDDALVHHLDGRDPRGEHPVRPAPAAHLSCRHLAASTSLANTPMQPLGQCAFGALSGTKT